MRLLNRSRRVAVLGAGPAGLLAAHAARECGYEPTVFSAPGEGGLAAKSPLYGCQYLHRSIPGLTLPKPYPVQYQLIDGTSDEYRRKVYGEADVQVSPDEFGSGVDHMAWDLRKAYDDLWGRHGLEIVPVNLSAGNVHTLLDDRVFRKVFSTIPMPKLCTRREDHKFQTEAVYAMGTGPGNVLPFMPPPFTVICNADPYTGWYRVANVFGYGTIEWPGRGPKPPYRGVVRVDKPLANDCDCWGRKLVRLGRYGQWKKGVLVHTAYETAKETLG